MNRLAAVSQSKADGKVPTSLRKWKLGEIVLVVMIISSKK